MGLVKLYKNNKLDKKPNWFQRQQNLYYHGIGKLGKRYQQDENGDLW